jgi:hypothetical protein
MAKPDRRQFLALFLEPGFGGLYRDGPPRPSEGFGAKIVPTYYYNYKVSELLLSLIVAATFSAMPKIARWLASSNQTERTHGIQEILRLHRVEVVLTCGCALGYLALNEDFVRLWLGRNIHGPIQWQFAFALSLVITGCADAAVQTAPRCSQRGLRISGIAVAVTALINVGSVRCRHEARIDSRHFVRDCGGAIVFQSLAFPVHLPAIEFVLAAMDLARLAGAGADHRMRVRGSSSFTVRLGAERFVAGGCLPAFIPCGDSRGLESHLICCDTNGR